jgi:hypothetical protein
MHAIIAAAVNVPELELDQSEADRLAKALGDIAKHHPTVINPRVADYVHLATALGVVYGPRVMAIRHRRAKEKQRASWPQAEQTTTGQVASIFGKHSTP